MYIRPISQHRVKPTNCPGQLSRCKWWYLGDRVVCAPVDTRMALMTRLMEGGGRRKGTDHSSM